ncbi:ABC transporter substrate-binding protein [Nostoc linckia z18]|jgi:iron complex transport system substrate-binding protein|uniref:ABC transporter substrate-binding protein n=2 Tax=Nostoc linckia TaxID=92942 RepID=A0A9Q6EMD2_NOSLI|nr:cobalamin-binding protein [Nostoc linckia]PHK31041.1 ABC transporter substrate-binding protein [Nostoc linckia z15]PHK40329.1 ABC transporter substrate-binding protein [Nostoc linckia z16]PHJ67558.1 ABC transporter substrate-binding protein [Nostoc linckia z1]PHJ72584.1 ABC transporter substrate-binding protein [Nostoc linckia z3]PHJ73537.1 ABC transporter substrate-binding protein [Nostoc linckia z2]
MRDSNVRIVSLIPGGTEILAALGLVNAIVGRSHECDYPPEIENRPICTQARLNSKASSSQIHDEVNNLLQSALSIYQIKTDVLQQLQPTHILTQDQCDVCAVSLQEVEKAVATLFESQPQIISLQPNIFQDICADIERVGNIFGVDSVKLIENLVARVKICQQRIQGLGLNELPTVTCIEWTNPLMVAANWIPELVNLAGGQSLFSVAGQPSPHLPWETLIASNPDVIVFMPCGFDLNRTRQEAQLLTQLPEWQKLHATKTGRIYITDGNSYFNRPGPRLVDSLEILAEILHPEIFQYGYKGTGWEVLSVEN